jgi:Domain of unknown function (DUF4349)
MRPGLLPVGAVIAAASLVLTVSACSGGSLNSNDSAGSSDAHRVLDGLQVAEKGDFLAGGAAPGATRALAPNAKAPGGASALGLQNISAIDFGRSQIKTARIGLRSTTITTVTSGIENVADTQGGFVASENTVTDVHGRATSSAITIRVPVDSFDPAVGAVSQLGQVSDRRVSTQDVTGRVADVASRVTSAKDSITQLRLLFSHATKLGDIITLESELSDRESDLEALLAQQRALTNETTLSTISVQVSRPPSPLAKPTHHQDTSTGFVGGLKQGWDALAKTFVAVSHGLGAALPLGLTILVLVGLLWAGVRRIPRHRVDTSG